MEVQLVTHRILCKNIPELYTCVFWKYIGKDEEDERLRYLHGTYIYCLDKGSRVKFSLLYKSSCFSQKLNGTTRHKV